ncbi:MAG: DUF2779 domain-containing protein [Candidatus Wallbacteria bacterium]|nr:DUF2779 domain-containing protein [Candidatus Wallbacteria bacterium]
MITKNIFTNALACKTRAWRMMRETAAAPSLGEQLRIEEGMEIGKRARELWPDGILISDRNIRAAAAETASIMENPDVPALFEAAFVAGNCVARADIIERSGDGWNLYEVKSSVNEKPELKNDLAYTLSIFSASGIRINKAALLLISHEFRKGLSSRELFVELECKEEVKSIAEKFDLARPGIEKAVLAGKQPKPALIMGCKACEYFRTCTGQDIENHILDLPRLSRQKFDELKKLKISRIEDLPESFQLTKQQAMVRDSVQAGAEIIRKDALKDELAKVTWPAFYLDFETVKTALPLYPDIAPHEQIVTQYSIHLCSGPGEAIGHKEFLADPNMDCRRMLAENLLRDLAGEGSIIVYTSFEKTIVTGLCGLFPDLAEDLQGLITRLVDLEKIIRENYYHPGFHGSTSIKKVLPVLVPGMSYEGLEIGEGDAAVAAFAYMALGKYSADEMEKIRENLLKYCGQDTMAMVKLHQKLTGPSVRKHS